jgi:hypothetical protein
MHTTLHWYRRRAYVTIAASMACAQLSLGPMAQTRGDGAVRGMTQTKIACHPRGLTEPRATDAKDCLRRRGSHLCAGVRSLCQARLRRAPLWLAGIALERPTAAITAGGAVVRARSRLTGTLSAEPMSSRLLSAPRPTCSVGGADPKAAVAECAASITAQ